MQYSRPSFSGLNARISADLLLLPAALREPLSAAWARACHGLHGHLDWAVLQTSPMTCELERLYDFAALYSVPRLTATFSTGFLTATGAAGASVLAGQVARGANGLDYVVTAATALAANGTAPVPVRCSKVGVATNLAAGQTLTLVAPVAGVQSTLTVASAGLTGGADDEVLDDWRARVANEWQTVVTTGPRSGKPDDYVFWAKTAHPSVSGALVQLHTLGLGTVVVRPICNDLTDRLPTQAVLQAVQQLLSGLQLMADVRVLAPTAKPVNVSLHLAAAVDTAANRAAIQTSLNALVMREMQAGATVTLAELSDAIPFLATQYTLSAPTTDTVSGAGEVLVPRPVTWV